MPKRFRADPGYSRAHEDWLDLQENFGRSPQDVAGTDMVFVIAVAVATVALVLCMRWLTSESEPAVRQEMTPY